MSTPNSPLAWNKAEIGYETPDGQFAISNILPGEYGIYVFNPETKVSDFVGACKTLKQAKAKAQEIHDQKLVILAQEKARKEREGTKKAADLFQFFLNPRKSKAPEDENAFRCDVSGKNGERYTQILEKRSKRKYPTREVIVFQREGENMLSSWVDKIYLSQNQDGSFGIKAVCEGEESDDTLYDFSELKSPKEFVEAFNQITVRFKAKPIDKHLAGIAQLDPEFAVILSDFLGKDNDNKNLMDIRSFTALWKKKPVFVCGNWAEPKQFVFGDFIENRRVEDFKSNPSYALLEALMNLAITEGGNPDDPKLRKKVMDALELGKEVC